MQIAAYFHLLARKGSLLSIYSHDDNVLRKYVVISCIYVKLNVMNNNVLSFISKKLQLTSISFYYISATCHVHIKITYHKIFSFFITIFMYIFECMVTVPWKQYPLNSMLENDIFIDGIIYYNKYIFIVMSF